MKIYLINLLLFLLSIPAFAQESPSREENIAYLVTFGKDGQTSCGDDDFYQVFFFLVPKKCETPVYVRIFDPETSGSLDENIAGYNTEMIYTIYGGTTSASDPKLKKSTAVSDCKSGTQMATKTFGKTSDYSGKWYTFGPFDPKEGELDKFFNAYVLKLVIEGKSGNDGNLYKLFLSSSPDNNTPVEGGNIYTYKYHFRLVSKKQSVTHLYPYVDDKVVTVTQNNFDFDSDGEMKIISIAKNGHPIKSSGDNVWAESSHKIEEAERNTSLDLQVVKRGDWNNDMVIFITNQYGEKLPFFSIPIGGVPKYKMNINIKYQKSDNKKNKK